MIVDLVRDPADTFPEQPDESDVTAMRVWHCKYRSLQQLAAFENLSVLVVATFPDSTLDAVGALRKLRYLYLLHLPHVDDLAPLGQLSELETLRLHTLPSWDASGKTTTVRSLAPLADLERLHHLELFGVVPEDASLQALERCRSLQTVRVHRYPASEQARFYEATDYRDDFAPGPAIEGW